MSLIPRSFIDDLLARIDIVEVISSRVQLRKIGNNFKALCPFHTEKSPSFTVNSNKQFYYCFGCGAHGNAISFLMDFDRMDFIDAVESLAALLSLEVPREVNANQQQNQQSQQELYKLLIGVNRLYQQELRESQQAINYLKSRGLSGKICQRFNVGFAPSGWDNLAKNLVKTPQTKTQLIASGMLVNKDDRSYDRFRERIMFPIRDQRGNVIAFGGRTMGDETPKYLNSPETTIFNKSNELYGLFEAKQANRSMPYLLIVEGYMDVISLAQHDINCVVATLGTATTSRHIQKLFRYTHKIIFCFDGDQAGKKAAWRALQNTLPLMRDGVQAAFLFLPENQDPDTQIRNNGKEDFLARIKSAIPLSEFFFSHFQEEINMNTMDGRAEMAQQANELLQKMPAGVFQQLMLEKLAKLVHIEINELRSLQHASAAVNTAANNSSQQKHQQKPKAVNIAQAPSLIRSAIKLLLNQPQLAECIEDLQQISEVNIPYIELLTELLTLLKERLKERPNLSTGAILEHWRDRKETPALAKLAAQEIPISPSHLKSEFIGTIKRLYELGREQTIQELLQQIDSKNLATEDKIKLQKLISDAKIKVSKHEE